MSPEKRLTKQQLRRVRGGNSYNDGGDLVDPLDTARSILERMASDVPAVYVIGTLAVGK